MDVGSTNNWNMITVADSMRETEQESVHFKQITKAPGRCENTSTSEDGGLDSLNPLQSICGDCSRACLSRIVTISQFFANKADDVRGILRMDA